jgi:hypothetical protein
MTSWSSSAKSIVPAALSVAAVPPSLSRCGLKREGERAQIAVTQASTRTFAAWLQFSSIESRADLATVGEFVEFPAVFVDGHHVHFADEGPWADIDPDKGIVVNPHP